MSQAEYIAVVHREDDRYLAYCPEVGTIARGDTIENALDLLRTYTEQHLFEYARPDHGRPLLTTIQVSQMKRKTAADDTTLADKLAHQPDPVDKRFLEVAAPEQSLNEEHHSAADSEDPNAVDQEPSITVEPVALSLDNAIQLLDTTINHMDQLHRLGLDPIPVVSHELDQSFTDQEPQEVLPELNDDPEEQNINGTSESVSSESEDDEIGDDEVDIPSSAARSDSNQAIEQPTHSTEADRNGQRDTSVHQDRDQQPSAAEEKIHPIEVGLPDLVLEDDTLLFPPPERDKPSTNTTSVPVATPSASKTNSNTKQSGKSKKARLAEEAQIQMELF